MNTLQWGDEYLIGINEIDIQHREFVNIVNKIHWAEQEKYPNEIGIRFCRELLKYSEFHFMCEENMMFLNQYIGLNTQIVEHRNLLAVMKIKIEEFIANKISYDSFTKFAFNWLITHINDEDRKFGEFMKNKRRPRQG